MTACRFQRISPSLIYSPLSFVFQPRSKISGWWWWFSLWVVSDSRDPMDCSQPVFSVCEIFPARKLEWVAVSFSRGSFWPRDRTPVSHIVDRRFTVWATREVSLLQTLVLLLSPQFCLFHSVTQLECIVCGLFILASFTQYAFNFPPCHVFSCLGSSFLFSWIMSHFLEILSLFTHSLAEGHLGCFHVLEVKNEASVNIHVRVYVWS